MSRVRVPSFTPRRRRSPVCGADLPELAGRRRSADVAGPGLQPDAPAAAVDEARAMQTTGNTTSSRPMREVLAFTTLTYVLVLVVALALPHAHINLLLSTLAPATAVALLTFTLFRRGTRRELWRSFGLRRSGARTWGSAVGVPLLLCAGAFGTALLVGAGQLRPLHITGFTASNYVINTAINFLLSIVFLVSE